MKPKLELQKGMIMKANQPEPNCSAASDGRCRRRDVFSSRSSVALPLAGFAVLLMLLLSATRLRAATNQVTSLADAGPGSLRQVLAETAPGDTIVFGVTGSITLSTGELVLDKDLTIAGPGMTNLTISGNHTCRGLRVNPGVTALIFGMTFRDGKAPNGAYGTVIEEIPTPGGPGEPGGAIYTAGTLTLRDCRVSSSAAGNGGGGAEFNFSASAGGLGGSGGGIFNSGTLTLSNCVLNGNSAGHGGGSGATTYSPMSGPGGSGGGIGNAGVLHLVDTTLSGNAAGRGADTPRESPGAEGGAGGGVWNGGACVANRCTFSGNSAGSGGRGGGDSLDAGDGGRGGSGGGIWSVGSLALTNCTVSSNSSGNGGDGGDGYFGEGGTGGSGGTGGGISVAGNLSLVNCTIGGNTCGHGGVGGSGYAGMGLTLYAPDGAAGGGGGVASETAAASRCLNTLVALNFGNPPDVQGEFTSLGHNFISITNGSSGFASAGDLVGAGDCPLAPKIGPLADNSGPTLTLALLPGSTAVDAGTSLGAPGCDQRGHARPQKLDVDIGAFECAVHYVDVNSTNATPPYATWDSSATDIQDAVDAALAGDEIVVTNGIYATGGRAVYGTMTNRVAVDKPLTLRSVNGPDVTIIQGYQVPGTTNGDSAIRCVYLTNGARLTGFTLTNGATLEVESGGGVWCESTNASVINCVIAGNSAANFGGGACGGTLSDSTLINNSSLEGGGAGGATLNDCTLTENSALSGGAASSCILNFCTLAHNSATGGVKEDWDYASGGGGADWSTLNNCTLTSNSASDCGGGALRSTLSNCTLTGNSAACGGGVAGDWVCPMWCSTLPSVLYNCLVYLNSGDNCHLSELYYCCTTPMPTNGVGNFTNAPQFVDYAGGNLRLQSNSPCINAGNNAYAPGTVDLDGQSRIVSGTVDIGAYEYQGAGSLISYAWLQQFGLPTDGLVDAADLDRDGHTTWQEWRCLTDPTNALSALRIVCASPAGTNVIVTWQSVESVSYFLERATNVAGPPPIFTPLASDIPGQPETTTFTDPDAARLAPLFYRVGVGN